MSIKDYVKGEVTFQYYRAGHLYYQTEGGLLFPVPIEDTGEATFAAKDKGIYYMRYIRKHLEAMGNKVET